MHPTPVEVRGLAKSYGAHVALRGLDLAVPRGAVYGFLGPNGAGKTTALRILLGLLRADSGSATVLGHDCWREGSALRAHVGSLAGDVRLPGWMRGRDALHYCGAARGVELRSPGAALAERLDLDLDVAVQDMSRGMRQKLGLIAALAPAPAVLILDEPTGGLDPIAQRRLAEILRERAGGGATVLFSSHVLSEVQELCDRVAILRRGALVADEALASLRARAPRSVTVRFAGPAPDRWPECLHRSPGAVDGDANVWHADLAAPPAALIEWLGGQRIDDLELAPPDLDRLFHAYYDEALDPGSEA